MISLASGGEAQWDYHAKKFRRMAEGQGDITAATIEDFEGVVTLAEPEREMLVAEKAYCDSIGS